MELRTSPASVTLLPGLLEQIPVLLFAGDQDYICNYIGIEKLIDDLEWKGAKGFQVSSKQLQPCLDEIQLLKRHDIVSGCTCITVDCQRDGRRVLDNLSKSHLCQGRYLSGELR